MALRLPSSYRSAKKVDVLYFAMDRDVVTQDGGAEAPCVRRTNPILVSLQAARRAAGFLCIASTRAHAGWTNHTHSRVALLKLMSLVLGGALAGALPSAHAVGWSSPNTQSMVLRIQSLSSFWILLDASAQNVNNCQSFSDEINLGQSSNLDVVVGISPAARGGEMGYSLLCRN